MVHSVFIKRPPAGFNGLLATETQAGQLAVCGARVKEDEAHSAKNQIGQPTAQPARQPPAFAQGQAEVCAQDHPKEDHKRAGDPGAFSLDAPIDGSSEGITLGDVLADEKTDPDVSGDIDIRHARIDLARVLTLLTPAQQRLCQMLGDEALSVKEAAEELRIPRATL